MYNHTYIIYYEDLATPPTERPSFGTEQPTMRLRQPTEDALLELEWTGNATIGWNLFAHIVLVHGRY